MGIVTLGHAVVAVAQLRCDNAHRHSAHSQPRAVCVPQFVERDGWTELHLRRHQESLLWGAYEGGFKGEEHFTVKGGKSATLEAAESLNCLGCSG